MTDCNFAKRDSVIFEDIRVLRNLLATEHFYIPHCNYFAEIQHDIQPFMRKVVATWMLEVCLHFTAVVTHHSSGKYRYNIVLILGLWRAVVRGSSVSTCYKFHGSVSVPVCDFTTTITAVGSHFTTFGIKDSAVPFPDSRPAVCIHRSQCDTWSNEGRYTRTWKLSFLKLFCHRGIHLFHVFRKLHRSHYEVKMKIPFSKNIFRNGIHRNHMI